MSAQIQSEVLLPESEREPTTPSGSDRHSPMRVLLFDHTAQLGGGEIALLDLIRFFDRSRVTPIVVLGSDGPLVDRLRGLVDLHILEIAPDVLHTRKDTLGSGSVVRLKTAFQICAYVLRLADFIEAYNIELIHTNSLKADILGGIAAKLTRTAVIWHIRDRITEDYLPRSAVKVMRTLCRMIPDFIIGNSAATIETLQLMGTPPSMPVASGVNISAYEQAATSSASTAGEITIGLVGRICPWKGQHIFLQAAAEVHKRFPQTRFQIIGAALFNEQQYEREMRDLARTLELEHAVEFTGFRNDVPDLMRKLDILVHASTTGEPFGQVIVQAMAAGKPVVATNGGGVPEIVIHGITGFLVPMADATAMSSAICALLDSPETAAAMGSAGRMRVLEHFTIETSARKVEAAYAEVLSRRQDIVNMCR
jgi:glycosyltransferase involved in cell wall biosynthesis